ncbi:hypothetical protein [Tabrizicola oligotrophica]|uniref:Uncharacterized protein n=1 Tax=Tabrizicola oligotrophica TaxID=2710650 RepID=A0A6M0QU87_9RHOB|nr:hypothetical protein [Tabrizicola oligotrophica]NEY90384.1 hypothetical protein [Tabrizicola oligotrophica]
MTMQFARPFAFALFSLAAAVAPAAHAGEIADKAAEVESLLAAGDDAGAVAAAREVFGKAWEATSGLAIGETVLIAEPASGYGIYNPRPDDRFKIGEPVLIYAEPMGFGYGSPGEGLYSIGFFVDLKVMTEAGEVLGDLQNLTELDLTSRYPNREFQANLTYNLTGVPPGRYVLQTTLRDKNSAKIGSFENTVEFVE